MCPTITIADETFAILQQIAEPLVDTPDSTIRKALTVYVELQNKGEKSRGRAIGTPEPTIPFDPTSGSRFNPDSPPNLTHTSFISGNVGGAQVTKWNNLLLEAHAKAFEALKGDFLALQRVSEAHLQKGEITGSGFRPVTGSGFSVQGVDANKAWALSVALAKKFSFPISIAFRWQQKDGAAFPGKLGRMSWDR